MFLFVKLKQITKLLPNVCRSRDLVGYVLVFVLLLMAFLVGIGKVSHMFSVTENIKKEINEKTKFVQEYEIKEKELRAMPFRPIAQSNMDLFSSLVFQRLEDNRLDLVSFGVISGNDATNEDQKSDGFTFELVYSGDWSNCVQFLENFQFGDALLMVKRVKLEPDDKAQIKTTLLYKVYVQ